MQKDGDAASWKLFDNKCPFHTVDQTNRATMNVIENICANLLVRVFTDNLDLIYVRPVYYGEWSSL